MKREDWQGLRTVAFTALFLALSWTGCEIVATKSSLSPQGTGVGEAYLSLIGGLTILLSMLGILLGLPLMAFPRYRKRGLGCLSFSIPLIFCVIVTGRICGRIRHQALVNFTERSKPLIAAIKAYQVEHGTPPADLKNLIPKYFMEVPKTGIGAYPEYKYFSGKDAREDLDGNPWSLMLWTPETPMDFDNMIYLPNQNYRVYRLTPTGMIGDWQYRDD